MPDSPEVTLGVIPGAGGTQRMPRLIGAEQALELILAARPVDVATAIKLGFIDAEVQGELRSATIAYARALLRSGAGARRTSERSVDPATATPAIFERLTQQAKNQYPNRVAALTAIKAVGAAAGLPFEQGLCMRPSHNESGIHRSVLVHIFLPSGHAKCPACWLMRRHNPSPAAGWSVPEPWAAASPSASRTGLPVTVIDASQEALDRGFAVIKTTTPW